MSFLENFSKNPAPEEILKELQRFLGRAGPQPPVQTTSKGIKGKGKKVQPPPTTMSMREMTHSGLWLIRHLPVSRDAVFDFISATYDEYVKEYLSQAEGNASAFADGDMKILDDIHEAFIMFLEGNGEIWAPILSQWTLHLLGQLSQDYSKRLAFSHVQTVNEIIHIWMGSKAIQSLLELTSRCLTCRDHANADAFISALLDTSAIHSPHFDWVVAHVGNSYPQTVVSQVLNLGLQNFSSNPPMVSKLSSVVGILGHLVTTHSKEVQHAFDQTLQHGLSDNNVVAEKYSVPYLLQMCSSSVPLLDVLMDSALPRVKEEALQKLRTLVPKWIQLHFGGHEMGIVSLVTHLILKSSRGPKALEIVMSGCKTWSNPVGHYARKLLDHLTAEVSSMVYESDSTRKDLATNFPCFSAMKENASIIIEFLTDSDPQVCRTAKQFVQLLSLYDGAAIGVKAVCHYLRESKSDTHLWHLVDLVGMLEMKYSNLLADSIRILAIKADACQQNGKPGSDASKSQALLRPWKNILKIVKSESIREKLPIKYKMSTVLQENLAALSPLFDVRKIGFCMEEASLVVEILSKIPNFTRKCRFATLLCIQRHLVEYLFKVLSINCSTHGDKVKNVSNISKSLYELSENPAIQNDALRSLVQYSLHPECKQIFMPRVIDNPKLNYSAFDFECIENEEHNEFQPEKFAMYVSLMKENQQRSATLCVSGSHATTFHSGKLLQNGIKNWSAIPKVVIKENADAYVNFELFLSVLLSVCMARPDESNGIGNELSLVVVSMKDKDKRLQNVSVEAMKKVALLLVEIVSPDVMFNGLPWPEEEFSRVQVERDLQIKRAFEDHPYLWDLLELVANHCPSLCYCSVLLRALMATQMAHWTSCQEASSKSTPKQLEWTIRLLQIMRTGQLLPPPLGYIGQVVHELRANEVLGMLKDIWAYMKINVPVPTIFIQDNCTGKFMRNPEYSKVDLVFTERLRLAILNNIESLGYLYPKLFPPQDPQPQQIKVEKMEIDLT